MFHRKANTEQSNARAGDVKVTLVANADGPLHKTDLLLKSFVQLCTGRTLRYVSELDGINGRMVFVMDRGPMKNELVTGQISAQIEAYEEDDGEVQIKIN